MAITFTDPTTYPVIVAAGAATSIPFSAITVNDSLQPDLETITVSLTGFPSGSLGNLSDPLAPPPASSFTNNVFAESATSTGSPTPATMILNRLTYAPPSVAPGDVAYVAATINVNGTMDSGFPSIETVGAPKISFTTANQPVASGNTIMPFGAVQIAQGYIGKDSLTATITVTDGGSPTDADGLFSGIALSKTGTGTYSLTAPYSYSLQNLLDALKFSPIDVAAGATRSTNFEVKVDDATTKLSADDKNTSVLVIGPPVQPTAPLIAGTVGNQTVAPGNSLNPFRGVTITDTNPSPMDSAQITVTGGGILAGANVTADATGTIFTIAAENPADLTKTLDNLTYVAPPLAAGQTSSTSTLTLAVTDGALTATDSNTTIIDAHPPDHVVSHFSIGDQTTGQQIVSSGDPYTGPVQGIDWQLIDITTDKLNITAQVPNVFIHSGSGDDAIDVSTTGGTNVLDGSTGSNFLVGGAGHDTFYVDDRNAATDIWSTVKGFHSGDDATVWGITPADFTINKVDNEGATGATGLTFHLTAPGKPEASLTLSGYTTADLVNGKLSVAFGKTQDMPDLPGSTFMGIHAV